MIRRALFVNAGLMQDRACILYHEAELSDLRMKRGIEMDYFLSHIGVIFAAACFVALCAVGWWALTERNAKLKRQRAEARRKVAESASTNPPK